jgi:predicted enzyme related to lactoylglutathione lyase
MARVTGIGGIFIKSPDPQRLRAWYQQHLGFDITDWGGATFRWHSPENPTPDGVAVWSVMSESSTYFDPSRAPFMVNYRVDDLHALLAELRAAGCDVDQKTDESELGKFGWVIDPDGNRLELWELTAGRVE